MFRHNSCLPLPVLSTALTSKARPIQSGKLPRRMGRCTAEIRAATPRTALPWPWKKGNLVIISGTKGCADLQELLGDGLHPTAAGLVTIADCLMPLVNKLAASDASNATAMATSAAAGAAFQDLQGIDCYRGANP